MLLYNITTRYYILCCIYSFMTTMERPKKDSIDRLASIASYALPALSGAFWATMDVTTTGSPYFTIGAPVYTEFEHVANQQAREDLFGHNGNFGLKTPSYKTRVLRYVAYAAGASTPFAIAHRAEVWDAAMKLLEYVK
jgi:hypothetical protein